MIAWNILWQGLTHAQRWGWYFLPNMNSCLQSEFDQRGSGNCRILFLALEDVVFVTSDLSWGTLVQSHVIGFHSGYTQLPVNSVNPFKVPQDVGIFGSLSSIPPVESGHPLQDLLPSVRISPVRATGHFSCLPAVPVFALAEGRSVCRRKHTDGQDPGTLNSYGCCEHWCTSISLNTRF
jgi:hypothetical protein